VAGFAAFQISDRTVPEASNARLGHEVGALAGLGFNSPTAQTAVAASVSADSAAGSQGTTTEATTEEPVDTLPTHGWLSEMQMRALISKYFQPEDVNRAIRVAWCESSFNPTSTNHETGATGLFHHLPEFWAQRAEATGFAGAEPTDAEANVAAAAYAVYEEGGWEVFNCSP
ncbi:MAG TPA: hypothetical protein VJ938_06325, partial [Acidimicrobiia bacterium]|nr:hypothetical protein [Acidimicrobiia bacterium]